jgi:hypothetical protein
VNFVQLKRKESWNDARRRGTIYLPHDNKKTSQ